VNYGLPRAYSGLHCAYCATRLHHGCLVALYWTFPTGLGFIPIHTLPTRGSNNAAAHSHCILC